MNYLYPNMPNRLYPSSPLLKSLNNSEQWVAEIKKNGWRCIVKKDKALTLYSRHKTIFTAPLTEIRSALSKLPDGTVLDGELLSGKRIKDFPESLYVFDILMWKYKPVWQLPLADRRVLLELNFTNIAQVCGKIELANQYIKNKMKLYYNSIENENEGIVIKKLNSVYCASESRCLKNPYWLKVKRMEKHVKTLKQIYPPYFPTTVMSP